MPEGDTVHRTCARLHEALAGRVVRASDLRWPGVSTADLTGMTVVEVVPRGKHILVRLDSGWTLHSHLRMEGQWRLERTGAPAPVLGAGPGPSSLDPRRRDRLDRAGRGRRPQTATTASDARAILVTDEWTAIGLRLGALDLVRTAAEHTLVGHLGPDILDAEFDLGRAVANLAASGTTVGAALLEQRNLAGIGTLWASESLFLEHQHPWAMVGDLTEQQLTAVVARARRLMLAALPHAVQSSTGSRRHGENTYVHGRSGRPCRRCGGTVRVAMIGPPTRERTMFYCPACQGGLAPTDDGRPLGPLGSRPPGHHRGPA